MNVSKSVGISRRRAFSSGLRRLLWVGLVWLAVVGGSPPVRAEEASDLARRIDRLVSRKPLAGASVGILVVRARDGRALYAHGADQLLIPASNQKILTTLAALHRFGPTHRFPTRVWAPGAPNEEGRVGGLVVEGGGDPVMNSEDWWRLAADLRGQGLRGVEGDLLIDDSLFEGPGWHPSWGRVSARAYHAPVGALTANYGSFFVSVRPRSEIGAEALVEIDPPISYLRLRNLARTGASSAPPRLSVDRVRSPGEEGAPAEIVRVEGVTRLGDATDRFPRSVLDPGLYAGSLLAYQLATQGIQLDGVVQRASPASEREALLLERPGRTLAEIVQLCMKYSNNSIAETLVKNMAAYGGEAAEAPRRRGDWVNGVRALRAELAALGIDVGKARIVDGSGLSLQNRLAPRMLVEALRAARDSFRVGPEFMASMPIADRDGTLEERLPGGTGRIRAKTGLLSDASVTALSGYAERADGETLLFSILVNGHSGGSGAAMEAVDRIAQTLIEAPLPLAAKPAR